jgi:hypothetical protein
MSVMARKTSETTGGVSERYIEDRRARITQPALADTAPQQRLVNDPGQLLGGV